MKHAILMAIEDCNRVNYITKLLYPEIAKKCKTTTSSVERAIRHAIDIVWIKGNQELLKEIFGKFVMEGQELSDKFTIYCSGCRLDATRTPDKSFIRMKIFWRIR